LNKPGAISVVVRKIDFRKNQHLQLFDFIEADFGIFIVFEFFLMTCACGEYAFTGNSEEPILNHLAVSRS
jgi:hypothetical protein